MKRKLTHIIVAMLVLAILGAAIGCRREQAEPTKDDEKIVIGGAMSLPVFRDRSTHLPLKVSKLPSQKSMLQAVSTARCLSSVIWTRSPMLPQLQKSRNS